MASLVDFVALSLLPTWRWRSVVEALREGRAPWEILAAQCAASARAPGTARGRLHPGALLSEAADAVSRGVEAGLDPVQWTDPSYPPWLAAIVDPPPVLWVRGNRSALDRPAVAIVGSRAGSPYALAVAERLASDLAAQRIVVVSGLARGVDSAAHRGALLVAGSTIAVMGCGADRVYPGEHRALARDIAASGAVLSELAPGTPPRGVFFPRRNRIISGLSRAVVVVEAGIKSGSLITARCALEQGRDVLAVPGNILSDRNRGGHALLRDGAKIVESADDILEELGLGGPGGDSPSRGGDSRDPSSDSDPVLASLTCGEPCGVDVVASRSGLPVPRLLPRLLELELRGLIRRAGGGRFIRVDTSC
jgi:DNA processing protein